MSGCGFQLRGTDIGAMDSVRIIGSGETGRRLQAQLEAYGVETSTEATTIVRLRDERSTRRPVSTTAAIDAAEYELRLTTEVEISRAGELLQAPATMIAERIYAVDSINLSASYEEQEILLSEMRDDLVNQIIRQLEIVAVAE